MSVKANKLLPVFANYIVETFTEDQINNPDFIDIFFESIGTDEKNFEVRSLIQKKSHLNICSLDWLFFIKYFFQEAINVDIDFTKLDLSMNIREELDGRYDSENLKYMTRFDRIIFDSLHLSKGELNLPCLVALKANISIPNPNPDDEIIIHAAYVPLYYYAYTDTEFEKFAKHMGGYQGQQEFKKLSNRYDQLHNFLVSYNLKVTLKSSEEVIVSGKRNDLFVFEERCSDEEFALEPFYDWVATYYEEAISNPFADEWWCWKMII